VVKRKKAFQMDKTPAFSTIQTDLIETSTGRILEKKVVIKIEFKSNQSYIFQIFRRNLILVVTREYLNSMKKPCSNSLYYHTAGDYTPGTVGTAPEELRD